MFRFLFLLLALIPLSVNAADPSGSVSDSGPRWLYEQGSNPTCRADRGVIFSKEVGGVSEFFYMSSSPACDVTQITSGGIIAPSSTTPIFVGLTTLAYDGDAMGTYVAANSRCVTDTGDAEARVCTDLEIAVLVGKGSTFGGATDEVWVNDGAPGYTSFSNDCDGWASVAVGYYGAYWNLNTKKAYASGCAMSKKYACCK